MIPIPPSHSTAGCPCCHRCPCCGGPLPRWNPFWPQVTWTINGTPPVVVPGGSELANPT